MIQAVFFDIDGTLTDFTTHEIPDDVFSALSRLKEKGIRLFIATGRGPDGLSVLKQFPFSELKRNGLHVKSTPFILSLMILTPIFTACCLILSVNSVPETASGNPGKFSTFVVMVSCPPTSKPETR